MTTSTQSDSHHGHGGDHEHSHGGTALYFKVFLALCVLTGASFFTYSDLWPFKDTPAVGWIFMMAVSCTKALLVMTFFMHLLWESNWKYVLTIPASMMSVFLIIALVPDVGQRTRTYSEERLLNASEPGSGHEHGAEHADGKSHEETSSKSGKRDE